MYMAEGATQACLYHNPESELHSWFVPECRGISDWLVQNWPMIYLLIMADTRIANMLSIDFECPLTIYTKSRLIITVFLQSSFIPLLTRTEKTVEVPRKIMLKMEERAVAMLKMAAASVA